MLHMSRARINQLARAGEMPGLVRKEAGGHGGRGRYLFDAEVVEQHARQRIAELAAALDETRAAS